MIYIIIFLAFLVRLYGINWDQGFFLHPDERMLLMVADRIKFFSQLNPNFFNYGSLPIYILKGLSSLIDSLLNTNLSKFNNLLYFGRVLSIIADTLTLILVYKISKFLLKKIVNKKRKTEVRKIEFFSLSAAFFYAFTFFPIQNSHFFIVDVFLTFFSTLLLFLLLNLIDKKSLTPKDIILMACVSAAITSTKVSGIVFVSIALLILIFNDFKRPKYFPSFLTHGPPHIINSLIFEIAFLFFSFIFMPYAFLEQKKFFFDVLSQIKMNSDPYVFPYTLQYVDTLPYIYHLKNIFLWGAGPVLSILALLGIPLFFYEVFKKIKHKFLSPVFMEIKKNKRYRHIPIYIYASLILFAYNFFFLIYYFVYFLILGKSAVKFMRYMLPIYPAMAILSAFSFYYLSKKLSSKNFKIATIIIFSLHILYLLPFLSIYSKPNTRVQATKWILKNIPYGSKLAVEHWDDRLPLYGESNYQFLELNLYDTPDNIVKWRNINSLLYQADYIIIASQRLYKPIQKLSDCKKYKICYPNASLYYERLFKELPIWTEYGPMRFKKVAEFTNYPSLKIPLLNVKIIINDESADESFTVYDHPKIMIFKKV